MSSMLNILGSNDQDIEHKEKQMNQCKNALAGDMYLKECPQLRSERAEHKIIEKEHNILLNALYEAKSTCQVSIGAGFAGATTVSVILDELKEALMQIR